MAVTKVWTVLLSIFLFAVRYAAADESQSDLSVESDYKVVGGTNAKKHIAPWMVSIQYQSRSHYYHVCGGSIISPEWIVTAGHCIQSGMRGYEVAAGRHDLKGQENSTEQRRIIAKTFVHPDYSGGIGPNDIALIQLQHPLIFTSTVSKLNLPTPGMNDESGAATLFGWGSTSRSRVPFMPSVLQTTIAPLLSAEKCRQIMRVGALITDANICTSPMNGRVSACSGDSGGPLVKNNTIVGIVSWGMEPCGLPNAPSVYTRVSKFTDWIKTTMTKEGKFFILGM